MTEGPRTQLDPNVSTEHQKDGDARKPSDTLNKDQAVRETGERDAAGEPVAIPSDQSDENKV
jgi:hypothetical protein